ncbi:hypothetical protein NC652_004779 [Populus alba x Populus x berolinensis]|nr:hypothetical protein NC652_004779 [Populus alba x Populus x berolinensis]
MRSLTMWNSVIGGLVMISNRLIPRAKYLKFQTDKRELDYLVGLGLTWKNEQDNFTAAITCYHKALWLKPDDQFCTEMLSLALVDEGRRGIDPKIEFR